MSIQDRCLTCQPACSARVPVRCSLQAGAWPALQPSSSLHVLWQAFQTMSHSRGVRQTLARLTSALAAAFQSELADVKKAFDVARRTASASAVASLNSAAGSTGTARYAGQAAATLQLVRRIDATWSILQVAAL